MAVDGMITVRSKSTRLPEKCYLPFGEGNLIEHVIRRAKFFGIDPIVCTTIEEEDNRIVEIAKKEYVRCYRGSVKDKLLRWNNACLEFDVKRFITVDADDPFFDGDLVALSLKTLGNDYDFVFHPPNLPYEGCVGYSLTADIINRACQIKNSDDTEMMWFYLEKVSDLEKTILPLEVDDSIGPIRLTLDYLEDYWLSSTVLRILGPHAKRKDIETLFRNNPDLHRINWFRNEEYKSNIEKERI